jgi:hypothetical protein
MEWTGTFEIPGSDTRVGGRLVIDEGETLLTTFGDLASDIANDSTSTLLAWDTDKPNVPMVWCVTEESKALTLLDLAYLSESQGTGPSGFATTRQQWIVGGAVEAYIEPVERATFSSVSFGLTDLSSWLKSPRPSQSFRWDEPSVELSVTTHETVDVAIDELTVSFGGRIGVEHGLDSITVEHGTRITATVQGEMSWQEMLNRVVTPLEVFLWIATGRFSALEEPRLRLDGDRPQYYRLWVSLLQPRRFNPPGRRLTDTEMLYTAASLPGGLESAVKNWFDVWDEVSVALGPVIARYRAPFSYSNDRFHSTVAALESYSERRRPPPRLSKAERRERRRRLEQIVREQAPDLKSWVMAAVQNADRPSLRTRLEHLLVEAGEVGEALTGEDREGFLSAVIKARNAYSHSTRVAGAIEGGAALHWATQGLNWVLRYYALVDIGFDPNTAKQKVLANHTFVQEIERLREALERPEAS